MAEVDPPTWLATILVAATAIGAVVAIVKGGGYLFRRSRESVRFFINLVQMQDAANRIISAELTKNHGLSLLDKIDTIAPLRTIIQENHAYAITQFESLAKADQQHMDTLEAWIAKLEVVERQQKFFRLLLDALLLELPDDRQNKVKALAERIQSDMDKGVA